MKKILTLVFLVSMAIAVHSQVPVAVHVQILKAEDARRWDAELEKLLASPNAALRERAALAAGRIGEARAVPALVKMLQSDASDKVRETAAFALGEIESIEAADTIRILIGETGKARMPGRENRDIRGRLVEAAGKIAAANAKDPKAKGLGEAILFTLEAERGKGGAQNIQTVILALTAAMRARPEGADAAAAKFLTSANPRIREDAANVLARLRAKNANASLRDIALFDASDAVRVNAIRALAAAEDKESVNLLIEAATLDKNSNVRIAAQRALATLRHAKAAERLLEHGEKLLAAIVKTRRADFIPVEQSEFIEVAVALSRILANTDDQRTDKLFADFGKIDKGRTPEVYIARVRVGPKRGDGSSPELTNWRQYSTLAQVVGEFAAIEPKSDVGKAMKTEAPGIIRPLAKAFAESDPAAEGERMMAGPDALQAFARFKTDDLGEVARTALQNKDVQMRATAAGILGGLPASSENVEALKAAFTKALLTDKAENDAQLAMLDAMFRLDKGASVGPLLVALNAPDYLVRKSAFAKLEDKDLQKDLPGVAASLQLAREKKKDQVQAYSPAFGTKLGQVLNADADHRRALSRKNGSISAAFTTQKGNFTIEFLPEDAPLTVDNFVKLARSGYFNGIEVHRVVPNFVMQDGDPRGDGNGGPGWSIRCEVNMVPYERGTVGMALSGKDTGGSQWFVTHSAQPHLDGGYTVFGKVNETGMKVVDKIVRGDKIISVRVVGR